MTVKRALERRNLGACVTAVVGCQAWILPRCTQRVLFLRCLWLMTELLKMGILVANNGWLCPMGSRVYGNIGAGPVVSAGPWLNPEWLSLGGGGAGCFSTWSPQGSYWIVFASFFGHVVTGWPFLQINYHKTRSWRSLWLRSLQSCSVIRIMSRLLLPLTQSHPQADPLN